MEAKIFNKPYEIVLEQRQQLDHLINTQIKNQYNKEQISYAIGLAQWLHSEDRYGQGPYERHILAVPLNLNKMGLFSDDHAKLVIAGVCHDAVEDHPQRIVKAARLAGYTGTDPFFALDFLLGDTDYYSPIISVSDIVRGVTNKSLTKEQKARMSKPEKFDFYYVNIEKKLWRAPWQSIIVKIADSDHNIENIGNTDWGGVVLSRTKKYMRLPGLYDRLVAERLCHVTTISTDQLEKIAEAIIRIEDRLSQATRNIVFFGHMRNIENYPGSYLDQLEQSV